MVYRSNSYRYLAVFKAEFINHTKMKRILSAAFFAIIVAPLSAQLTTSNNMTISEYVQEVLLGANVSVSNITYNGGSANVSTVQVGGFDCLDCNLGIESGFAMSSGDVNGMAGPNNSTAYTYAAGLSNGPDPDLQDLITSSGGNSSCDWAIIEFDFVPLGDTIRFNYVFGSEEYDTYTNSGFTDVFGFFLSGPGISGSYSNGAENIALIPGTNLPVSINNVNNGAGNAGPCENCEYYNQLENDNFAWTNPDDIIYTDPYYMQYDGYTDVLTAMAVVQCGETYHIKLAVADANDQVLDSGVFLERESFTSNLVVQTYIEFEVGGPEGNTLFEDCGEATIIFERPETGDINTELTAYLSYSGTAIMGTDYSMLPDSVVFAPGVQTVSFPLDAFEDGIAEGVEFVHMDILNFAECSDVLLASQFEFEIWDTADPLVVTGYTEQICQGATAEITPIIQGGYGAYNFDWSTGEDTQSIFVTPEFTTTYNVIVSDTCGMPSDDADITIDILDFPDLSVSIDSGDLLLDCGESVNLTATGSGGDGIFDYYWFDEDGNNLWGWENTLWYSSWNGEGEVHVELTDGCGFTAYDSINVELNVPDLIVDVPDEMTVTCNVLFNITADVSGGQQPYYYYWYTNGVYEWDEWDAVYDGTFTSPGIVTVQVGDNCGQSETFDIDISIESPPIDLVLIDELSGNCNTIFDINPTATGGSGDFDFVWSENGTPFLFDEDIEFQTDISTTLTLLVSDECSATATDEVNITIINPPVDIEVGEDINASCIDNTLLEVDVLSGSGGYEYIWMVDGNVVGNDPTYTIQSYETVNVSVVVQDACLMSDNDMLTYFIPDIPLTITTSADTSICVHGSAHVWALAEGGEGGFSYVWPDLGVAGDDANIHDPNSTHSYTVVATDICGESISAEVVVELVPLLAGFISNEIEEDLFQFTAQPSPECDNCTYIWDFGDGSPWSFEPNPQHKFDGLESYTTTLTVINDIGCSDEGDYLIVAPAGVYIPNSFTPNGDGINDYWQVVGRNILKFELYVFNRWGDVVFSSADPDLPWIGDCKFNNETFAPNGVYNYFLKVKGYDSDAFEKRGTITLMR